MRQPDDPGVEPLRAPETDDEIAMEIVGPIALSIGIAFIAMAWLVYYFR